MGYLDALNVEGIIERSMYVLKRMKAYLDSAAAHQ